MLKLNGDRIYLRDHITADLTVFHAWMSDPIVTKYLSVRSDSIQQSVKQLAHAMAQNHASPRKDYFFAIVESASEQIIGEAGFSIQGTRDGSATAEIGYFLFQPYWEKGYATEAAQLMIHYCFYELKLNKVTAGCDAENLASEKVMIHCGMHKEAYIKQHRFVDGVWRDRLEYAILRKDWDSRF